MWRWIEVVEFKVEKLKVEGVLGVLVSVGELVVLFWMGGIFIFIC